MSALAGIGAGGLALSACARSATSTPLSSRSSTPEPAQVVTARSAAAGCTSSAAKITASATGSVTAKPNLLTISIDVHTKAPAATTALHENNAQAAALIATLKAAGLASADLETSGLSIMPSYSGSPAHVSGYQVDDTVTARVHKLSSAGSLIDAAAAKLGNDMRFEGLAFSLTNDAAASLAARTLAVHTAAARARAMSAAAGARLGALCSVSDLSTTSQPLHQPTYFSAAAGTAAAGVPVQSGTQQVSARVKLVYGLR